MTAFLILKNNVPCDIYRKRGTRGPLARPIKRRKPATVFAARKTAERCVKRTRKDSKAEAAKAPDLFGGVGIMPDVYRIVPVAIYGKARGPRKKKETTPKIFPTA